MPHIVKSTVLDAPTGAVWNVLRDFNGHDRWHPAVATSTIERAQSSDRIGCVRRFKLKDGSELREQLLALSDLEQTFSYCLLDTPIPMFNYVAHVRLLPVTALAGAIFLMLADTLARTLFAPSEVPVGILMAFVGGPFFLYLLRKMKRNYTV